MLRADAQDLKTVFEKQRKHKVPLYQRRYVWDQEKQWEPLWEDIESVAHRRLEGVIAHPHFLGAVVLKQDETPSREIETRLVIDGQQRLTTLQLVLAAARDVYSMLDDRASKYAASFNFLVENQAGVEREEDIFKVWPTQADQENLSTVLTSRSHHSLGKLTPTDESPILEAYLFFSDKIDGWIHGGGDAELDTRAEALQFALLRGLMLVVIDLSLEDDAQVIFESLNARGTPLLQSELVKNYLLHLAEERHLPSEELHEEYWKPFESDKFWQEEVKQGRLYRQRIEIFLQHYLSMHLAREVSAVALFDEFKKYAAQPDLTPRDHMANLSHFGDLFRSFSDGPTNAAHGVFFYRVDVMEVTTLIPLLLFVFDRLQATEDASDLRSILLYLDSFLVRRMVCRLTTKQYNKLFLDLKSHLDGHTTELSGQVREFLLSREADSEIWPDDSIFHNAWMTEPLYRRMTRSRLRMILEALEATYRTDKTEDVPLPKGLTIEHLLPRAWEENWPLPGDSLEDARRREDSLHTIGNLTLLTSSLNPALRNGAWHAKRREIIKHSVLKLNTYFHDLDDWNEGRIAERGEALFGLALEVWPRPTA